MEGAEFWNMIGAIGQWAGAIATFAAVVVALRTSQAVTRVNFRISVQQGTINGPIILPSTHTASRHLIVQIVNNGHKPAKVRFAGFMLPDGMSLIPVHWSSKMPCELKEGDAISLEMALKDIAADLRAKGHRKAIRLRAFACDSSGKHHTKTFKIDPLKH